MFSPLDKCTQLASSRAIRMITLSRCVIAGVRNDAEVHAMDVAFDDESAIAPNEGVDDLAGVTSERIARFSELDDPVNPVNPVNHVVDEPVAVEPVADEPVVDEPVAVEPVAVEPVVDEPVADEPVAVEPVEQQLNQLSFSRLNKGKTPALPTRRSSGNPRPSLLIQDIQKQKEIDEAEVRKKKAESIEKKRVASEKAAEKEAIEKAKADFEM